MRNLHFCGLAFLLTFVVLSTFDATVANDVPNPDNSTEYKFCTSQICEEAGREIVESLDHSVEPCVNFYNHACGGWIAKHPIPEAMEGASQFNVLAMKSQAQLKEILENNDTSNSETFRKVTDYYRSCKNLTAIDARGLSPLESIVLANGGWPLTLPSNNWCLGERNLTLQKIHENYAKVAASSALFTIAVLPDLLNSSVNLLQLTPPTIPINRQRFFVPRRHRRDTRELAYVNYIKAVGKELADNRGFHVSVASIDDDANEILKFEAELTKLHSSESGDELDNGTSYRVTTIDEVQNTWNTAVSGHPEYAIDWLETIRSAFDGTGVVINATEKVGLEQGDFIKKLADLLKKYSLRAVVNYVHWHAIDSLVPYTNKKMRHITNGLLKNLYGYEDKDDERSIFCIGQHKMQEGLSYLYVQKYFGSPLTTAINMVSQIQEVMKRQIDQSTWMDNEAKLRSKEKVDNVVKNIGYPSWYDEPGKIDEYYSELIVGSNYFENVVNHNRFKTITSLKTLREPYDRYKAEWAYPPIIITGAYMPSLNSINFPAVNFQMPFFDADRPLVMNYGSIGALIGHELSHAFDNDGRKYDKVGNRRQWWSDSVITSYNERAKCFVDQYSNYTLIDNYMNETIYIDGEYTLGENIADNTGFAVALKAYLVYKKEHNLEDIRIPALKNYTDEKLFFYSLSNYFCSLARPEALANLKYDVHSSVPVRINGVVSNMQEFSDAFNCPSGSPMNPVKKCLIWN